jgi:hypothetical protein
VLGSLDEPSTWEDLHGLSRVFEFAVAPATLALRYVTNILQLVMNSRSRTFAGQSRTAVALLLLVCFPKYMVLAGMFGRNALGDGVSWDNALHDVLLLGLAWQALTLPLVDQTAEDEAEK